MSGILLASVGATFEQPGLKLVAEITGISADGWTGGALREFTFSNSTAYRYWRFIFGSITNPGGFKSLVEWQVKWGGSTQSLNGKTLGNLGDAFNFGSLSLLTNNNLSGSDITGVLAAENFDVYVDLGTAQILTAYLLAPQYNPPFFNTPGSFSVYAANTSEDIQLPV